MWYVYRAGSDARWGLMGVLHAIYCSASYMCLCVCVNVGRGLMPGGAWLMWWAGPVSCSDRSVLSGARYRAIPMVVRHDLLYFWYVRFLVYVSGTSGTKGKGSGWLHRTHHVVPYFVDWMYLDDYWNTLILFYGFMNIFWMMVLLS